MTHKNGVNVNEHKTTQWSRDNFKLQQQQEELWRTLTVTVAASMGQWRVITYIYCEVVINCCNTSGPHHLGGLPHNFEELFQLVDCTVFFFTLSVVQPDDQQVHRKPEPLLSKLEFSNASFASWLAIVPFHETYHRLRSRLRFPLCASQHNGISDSEYLTCIIFIISNQGDPDCELSTQLTAPGHQDGEIIFGTIR